MTLPLATKALETVWCVCLHSWALKSHQKKHRYPEHRVGRTHPFLARCPALGTSTQCRSVLSAEDTRVGSPSPKGSQAVSVTTTAASYKEQWEWEAGTTAGPER